MKVLSHIINYGIFIISLIVVFTTVLPIKASVETEDHIVPVYKPDMII